MHHGDQYRITVFKRQTDKLVEQLKEKYSKDKKSAIQESFILEFVVTVITGFKYDSSKVPQYGNTVEYRSLNINII